ncbi:helix-turn-helix transcriptional regulator [Tsukamurella sp. 1534]|uniref:helix-turn-helix domain-containing protein n=1 Tax=Tsukamurella sp. 1534 TaxID=1151061 RepID=UPI0003061F42|nr:helix-turn-helix transcriptional regulator [Tsukamurella sp. 1534]
MTRSELAAALNVDVPMIDDWVEGIRVPDPASSERLDRALAAAGVEGVAIDAGLRRGPVRLPTSLWIPAFCPRGRFRLPLNLEWSGTSEQRWRDATSIPSLLTAYTIVMTEGRYRDMVRWIDPEFLAARFDEVLWPRKYEPLWRRALTEWGLL